MPHHFVKIVWLGKNTQTGMCDIDKQAYVQQYPTLSGNEEKETADQREQAALEATGFVWLHRKLRYNLLDSKWAKNSASFRMSTLDSARIPR